MRVRLSREEEPGVQMAPLIDCVFLLLIFFLVATTFKKVKREIPLTLPDSAAGASIEEEDDTYRIWVDKYGRIYLDTGLASLGSLHQRLRLLGQTNPDRRIKIDADRDTPFQDVVRVLDLCQFVGLENIGFHVRAADTTR